MKVDGLPPKQRRFVDEYLVDLNGTQAAIRAGYSKKSANEQAARLLAKDSVKAAVDAAMEARSKETAVTAAHNLRELSFMAYYDPADYADIKSPEDVKEKLTVEQRKAIVGWSWNKDGQFILKLSPKTPSQDLIGRHLGMFTNKLELSGQLGLRGEMGDLEIANRMLTLIDKLEKRAKGGADGDGAA